MNKAVVYHWWDNYEDCPYQNLRVPAVLSIATLRRHNPTIPIYLLDCSDEHRDWGPFPERLNFEVVPWKMLIQGGDKWTVFLSRMEDIRTFVRQIGPDEIIYCDSDVFWFKNPLPFFSPPDLFCSNRYNNGFFYFDKTSLACQKFFDLFAAYSSICLNDKALKEQIVSQASHQMVAIDEIITDRIYRVCPEIVCEFGSIEHCITRNIPNEDFILKDIKMVHCNGLLVNNQFYKASSNAEHARGLVCLVFKELYDAITSVLSPEDLHLIFRQEELDHYTGLQISMLSEEYVQRLKSLNVPYDQDIELTQALSQAPCKRKV